MNNTESNSRSNKRPMLAKEYLIFVFVSLVALIFTFLIAISGAVITSKIIGLFAMVVAYGVFSFGIYRYFSNLDVSVAGNDSEDVQDDVSEDVFTGDVDETLAILDEAGKFFSASLKSDDMFRLVASRIQEVVPHSTSVLYLSDEKSRLKVTHSSGDNSRQMTTISVECDEGLAGKAFVSGEIELDSDLSIERKVIDEALLNKYQSAIAAPVKRGAETYGVLVLYGEEFGTREGKILAAMSERISPLLTSSFSFEENISKSMIDSLTNLPNERAFYLVLENQIAESQRFQKQRPLTILLIDIRDFADFNRMYGHSTGDSLLAFASEVIGGQLRDMDFLCRSMSDEFWVVLPTASNEITKKIVERIERVFAEKVFELADNKIYRAKLNFGSATFLRDGETTNHLLQKAFLRKKQSKEGNESSVIMFPKEYVN